MTRSTHLGTLAKTPMTANNQGFSNYLLDQSVVQDNNTGGHGTAWNSTAEALVKTNPSRFQYVDNPNYIKGTDY
jgi:hypothetical protein